MRLGPLEARLELELHERELVPRDFDRRDARARLETLTVAGAEEDRARCGRPGAGSGVEAVEAALLAAVPFAQVVRETPVRRVEVEEPRWCRAAEPMDDFRRRADTRPRRKQLLLVADENGELALEHVERIRVPPMEVRVGSGPCVRKERLGDAELFEVGLEHDATAEQRFALARSEHDPVHRRRV